MRQAKEPEKTVFLSYRRKPSEYMAWAIYQFLTYRGFDVFLDVETINSGAFSRVILSQIDARAHFIPIITHGTLDRCVNEGDWVRREIEYAIATKRNIVPIMMNGFTYRDAEPFLKGDLKLLPEYNTIFINSSFYFDDAMEALVNRFLNISLDMVLHPIREDETPIENRPQITIKQLDAEASFNTAMQFQENGKYERAIAEYSKALNYNPAYAQAYFNRGWCYTQVDNPYQAEADYTQAIQHDPKMFTAYFNRGWLRDELGQYEDAITDYNHALDLQPDFQDVYLNRGLTKSKMENFDGAIADFTHLILLNPEYVDAHIRLGEVYVQLESYADAIKCFQKALSIDPLNVAAKQGINHAYNSQVAVPEKWDAEEFFEQAYEYQEVQDYSNAIQAYSQAIEVDPDHSEAYYHRGWCYQQLEAYSRAIEDYSRTLAIDPKHLHALFSRGWVQNELEDYASAIMDFTEVIQNDANDTFGEAYYYRGNAYYYRGFYEGAIADYHRAVKLDSDNAHIVNNLGNAYAKLGNLPQAIASYEKALQLDPDYAEAKQNLTQAYYAEYPEQPDESAGEDMHFGGDAPSPEIDMLQDNYETDETTLSQEAITHFQAGIQALEDGQYELAIEHYNTFIRKHQRYAEAYYNRGCCHHHFGNLSEAQADYTHAIYLDPNHVPAYLNRAHVKYDQKDWHGAIADYATAIEFVPNHARAYHGRGIARCHVHQLREALADFSQAIALQRDYDEAYHHRGHVYYYLGDKHSAIADYQTALRINPNHEHSRYMLEQLQARH